MIRIVLKELLEKKGMTAYRLAEDSGLSKATIYDLIKGKKKGIDYKTLDSVCRILVCHPGDLLIYENDEDLQNKSR